MQLERLRSHVHTQASGSLDEKFGRLHDKIVSRERILWLDEESGRVDDEIVSENEGKSDRRALHFIWFLLGMAVLGVLLAFTWRKIVPQLWATQPSSVTQRTVSAEQLQEIETLKRTISELREAQQQMAATIASSKVAQHELQPKPVYWYSDSKILMHPTVAASALPKQKSTARSRPETQGANVARRDQGVPLPLLPNRP
jgi:hypothetical protein